MPKRSASIERAQPLDRSLIAAVARRQFKAVGKQRETRIDIGDRRGDRFGRLANSDFSHAVSIVSSPQLSRQASGEPGAMARNVKSAARASSTRRAAACSRPPRLSSDDPHQPRADQQQRNAPRRAARPAAPRAKMPPRRRRTASAAKAPAAQHRQRQGATDGTKAARQPLIETRHDA